MRCGRGRRGPRAEVVDFHFLVPGRWTVRQAHDFTERVEDAVRAALPGAEVTIHIEPIEAESAWTDSELLPLEPPAGHTESKPTT